MGSLYLPESEARVNGSCNPIDHFFGGVLSFTTTSGKVESDKKKPLLGLLKLPRYGSEYSSSHRNSVLENWGQQIRYLAIISQ